MTVEDAVRQLRARLDSLYHDRRETEAVVRLIFSHVKNWKQVDILIHGKEELSPFIESEIAEISKRLEDGEPIQYITGQARFAGLDFKVTESVLIPRPETAELTDMIISDNSRIEDLKVLDIGTGSGCIAIVLSRRLPFSQVTGLDNSSAALAVAKENSRIHGVKNVEFVEEDIFKWQPGAESLDIIVSNPPYIGESERSSMAPWVKEHEPSTALFVPDDDPLVYYRRIGGIARDGLKSGGRLYFEINPLHATALKEMLRELGFNEIEIVRDSYGRERFSKALNPKISKK